MYILGDRQGSDDQVLGIVEPLTVEYRTFEGELKPNFCVYYLFNKRNMGLYKNFRIDSLSFIEGKCERVYPYDEVREFRGEKRFLDCLKSERTQGIFITLMSGLSFGEHSRLVADIHANSFFEQYSLLKDLGIRGLCEILGIEHMQENSRMDELFNPPYGEL
jgi:hypothetical protein